MRKLALKSLIEVGNRLDRLGTSRDVLLEVINAVVAARAECTENDPAGSRGWRGWQMGTRRNRELHGQIDGWEKDDTDQIASVVNRGLGIKIIVCNTDEGTCVEGLTPQNRSKKGAATERVVDRNQYTFFDKLDVPHPDSVVVPMRDAAGRLPALHARLMEVLQAHHPRHEVIYVDDRSTDHTWSMV
ncbi:MAG TPA: glycosyltransferase, partial [Devosia sp.]|nr:glycosyltransferase [Devosia sp.]